MARGCRIERPSHASNYKTVEPWKSADLGIPDPLHTEGVPDSIPGASTIFRAADARQYPTHWVAVPPWRTEKAGTAARRE